MNALAFGGNAREVVDLVPTLLPRHGRNPWLMMGLTAAYARLGLVEKANGIYAELVARSRNEYVQPAVLAAAADLAGRRVEALDHLRRGVEIRDPLLSAFALHSPPMATLRSAPEFRHILEGLGWNATFGPGYALPSVA